MKVALFSSIFFAPEWGGIENDYNLSVKGVIYSRN